MVGKADIVAHLNKMPVWPNICEKNRVTIRPPTRGMRLYLPPCGPPLSLHRHTWECIAGTQHIISPSCPFDCAMFVVRRDVYIGLVPKGLHRSCTQGLTLPRGGILGGGGSQPIPGKPTVKVACGARVARILPRSWAFGGGLVLRACGRGLGFSMGGTV